MINEKVLGLSTANLIYSAILLQITALEFGLSWNPLGYFFLSACIILLVGGVVTSNRDDWDLAKRRFYMSSYIVLLFGVAAGLNQVAKLMA